MNLKKYLNGDFILKLICLCCLGVVAYSIFTVGLTNVHSDAAAELTALDTIFRNKDLFPKDWVYGNGDINLMRNQIFLVIPMLLCKNWAVAKSVSALITIVLAAVALVLFGEKYTEDKFYLIAIPIILVGFSGITRDVVIYSGMYDSIIIYACIFIALLWKIYSEKASKIEKVLWCILLTLVTIGGSRWIAEYTLPFILTVLAVNYLDYLKGKSINIKRILISLVYVLIPSGVGLAIFGYVNSKCDFFFYNKSNLVLAEDLETLGKNIITTFKNFYICFGFTGDAPVVSLRGFRSVTSLLLCTLVCIFVPCLQIRRFKEENSKTQFWLLYGAIHNLLIAIVVVLTDKDMEYYLISSIFVCIIISSRYIYVRWIKSNNLNCTLLIGLFLVAIVVECASLLKTSAGWKERYEGQKKIVSVLEGRGLTKGFAGFWNSFTQTAYSNGNIRMGAVKFEENFIYSNLLLEDKSVFIPDEEKTFLLLTEQEYVDYKFYIDCVLAPCDYSEIISDIPLYNFEEKEWDNHCDLYLMEYNYDIATKINNGILDGVIYTNEMIPSGAFEVKDEEVILSQGGILYGPFNIMYAGNHVLKIVGDNVQDLSYSITCSGDSVVIPSVENSRENNELILAIDVEQNTDDFSIKLVNEKESEVTIEKIEIQ